jgi:hypothetical protein
MASWQDFTLDLVQTVIFTPDHSAFAAPKALATILAAFPDRFDGEMQVLPLPTELSPDIPHVQLRNSDDSRRLSMAPARIDSVWRNVPGGMALALPAAVAECAEVQERYVEGLHVRVGRVALLVHRYFPVEHPAQVLIDQFCKESSRRAPFNRSESFEIHNHKVYSPQKPGIDFAVNSWVRCKTARLVADNRPVILVEQDLNTLASEADAARFDGARLQAFFQTAVLEVDEILQKYFPG